jgi:hypothetical protein
VSMFILVGHVFHRGMFVYSSTGGLSAWLALCVA